MKNVTEMRICPVEVQFQNAAVVMGCVGASDIPENLLCPADCPGASVVRRKPYSPLSLVLGATKSVCGLGASKNQVVPTELDNT